MRRQDFHAIFAKEGVDIDYLAGSDDGDFEKDR